MKAFSFLERYDLILPDSLCGKNLKVRCFFHDENTASLHFNLTKDSFYCFSCGASGNLVDAIQKIENTNRINALRIYSELEDLDYLPDIIATEKVDPQEVKRTEKVAFNSIKNLPEPSTKILEYMQSRGFYQSTLDKFHIREFVGDNYPVVIPIYQQGAFKGICKRAIKDMHPKYNYNTGFRISKALGLYINKPFLPIFLCEGIMDAMSGYEIGYPNVCCQFGWKTSEEQLQLLPECDIICALDSDKVGEEGYRNLKEKFDGRVYRFDLCGYKDVNQLLVKDRLKFKNSLHDLIRRNRI